LVEKSVKRALLLILILSAVGCARDKEPEDQPSPEAAPAPVEAEESGAGEIMSKREITLTETLPPQQPQASSAPQSEQQKLLTLESSPVLPEDFEIGALADLVGIDRSTQELISVSTRFLDALQEGVVAEETLLAGVREELAISLRYYLDQELVPVTYRIGAITAESAAGGEDRQSPIEQRTAWMNLRLFGSPGVSAGELYLERSAGRWYISDLQVDFQRMAQQYVREEEVYYPSTYGWGIQ
jgi:hypothetical protein